MSEETFVGVPNDGMEIRYEVARVRQIIIMISATGVGCSKPQIEQHLREALARMPDASPAYIQGTLELVDGLDAMLAEALCLGVIAVCDSAATVSVHSGRSRRRCSVM